jgi:peptidoglycan/xylan/chitin deacetylase (PgdA/CDA1 family)
MTDIIFSFDTEDFTSSRSADGILYEANLFKEEGVKGCFCVVGLLAKQLKAWGREDVIEALSHHEIGTHTYGHTLHPMINEYTDIEDFYEAQNELIKQETLGVEYIKEALGVDKVWAACPPGNQKSYVAMYGYHKMGIPIYADTFCDTEYGTGAYYCNIFHANYTFSIEWFLRDNGEEGIKKVLDELAKRERAVIYTHPNMIIKEDFWDAVNYHKENLVPFGEWIEPKDLPSEITETVLKNMRILVKLVKNDPRFRIITYSQLAKELEEEEKRIVKKEHISDLYKSLKESFFPVQSPMSLSLSDIMLACRDLLMGKNQHICEDVYGFLSKPYEITEEITVSKNDIISACSQIKDNEFLPEKIKAGDNFIGPADWIYGAMEVLLGAEKVVIKPKKQLPSLDCMPEVRDSSFKGTWQHSDSFEDKYLSDRLRYQSYTMRFRETSRKITG